MPPKRTQSQRATPATQSKQNKAPVSWDKDGKAGYGSIKLALANKILTLMAQAGITHQDNKGIQTKIQELQTSYSKGSDFLHNAGSGLQDKDIDNGTTTLNAALTKICRYWDELHPIMALHNVSNPPETQESTKSGVPNLQKSRADNNASKETPPQSKKPNVNDNNDTSTCAGTPASGPGAARPTSKKRNASKKDNDQLDLELVMAKNVIYRNKALKSRESRDKLKMDAEKSSIEENKNVSKITVACKKQKLKIKEQKLQELKDLGHTPEKIKFVFDDQFSKGKRSHQGVATKITTNKEDDRKTTDEEDNK
ncbi:hypothetical protein PCASD_04235 [Puccinia coronata f. sp. avenae]|uniref:Uncharacterized protein n=1 Tax=Puccinia coronata f. sp. avenae TaxID=200324 RepID=A0A2N5VEV3_9BASI|nr:hypothetical protein PCASD_04235 [Puccinia coronata f. sp. avenae]